MYHIQLFADKPEERVTPKKDENDIDKNFIVTVFFLYMRQLVFKNFMAGGSFDINTIIPKNIIKKGEWCAFSIGIYK